jgi:hypothetical protein
VIDVSPGAYDLAGAIVNHVVAADETWTRVHGRPDALNRIQPGRKGGSWTTVSQSGCAPVNFRIAALTCVFRLSQQTVSGTCNWWCAVAVSPA